MLVLAVMGFELVQVGESPRRPKAPRHSRDDAVFLSLARILQA